MKKQYKLTSGQASNVATGYTKVQGAIEFFRACLHDCPPPVRATLLDVITGLQLNLEKIDKRIPKANWDLFKEQVKDNDSLRMEEILRLYHKLSPAQQELLEEMASGMVRGEIVSFEKQVA